MYIQLGRYKVFHVEHCTYISAAAAGAAAAHALVATAVAHHDGAADVATGSVSHVDHSGQGIGRVDAAGRWSLVVGRWATTSGAV